jgi:hypothetical protein
MEVDEMNITQLKYSGCLVAIAGIACLSAHGGPVITLQAERQQYYTGEPIILRTDIVNGDNAFQFDYESNGNREARPRVRIQFGRLGEDYTLNSYTLDNPFHASYPPYGDELYRDGYGFLRILAPNQRIRRVDVQVFSAGTYNLRAVIVDRTQRYESIPIVIQVLPVPSSEPIESLRDEKTAFMFGHSICNAHWFPGHVQAAGMNGTCTMGSEEFYSLADTVMGHIDHRLRPYVIYAYAQSILHFSGAIDDSDERVNLAMNMVQEFRERYHDNWLMTDLYEKLFYYYDHRGMVIDAITVGRYAMSTDPTNLKLDAQFIAKLQYLESLKNDVNGPVIGVLGEHPISVECGTPYTDAGATATDNKDGDLTASITVQNNVNPAVPGAYTVVYTVSDAAGNTTTATRTVNVVDTTAPVLTCLNAQVQKPETCGGGVNFAVPTALDQCAGTVAVTCTPASGDVLAAGIHTVNCSATDSANNTGTCSFTVDVKERLQVRFVAPLSDDNADNNIETDADVVNTFKIGSRVIHKVKLFDCAGNDVTEAYASLVSVKLDVTLRTTTNTGSDVVNDVPEVSSGVGNAGGLMIPVGDHFQYNLDTTGYTAGTVNDERFYRSAVTVEWVSAPGLVVGEEDALLESKP